MAKPIASDATQHERFEVHVDGELAGTMTYIHKHGRLALIHTEVLAAFEGKGVGSAIVRFALISPASAASRSSSCARSCWRTSIGTRKMTTS